MEGADLYAGTVIARRATTLVEGRFVESGHATGIIAAGPRPPADGWRKRRLRLHFSSLAMHFDAVLFLSAFLLNDSEQQMLSAFCVNIGVVAGKTPD